MTFRSRSSSALLAGIMVVACQPDSARELVSAPMLGVGAPGPQFEVWLIDQSNSPGTTDGGTLYIYEGQRLTGGAPGPSEVIDLGVATRTLCLNSTGTNPVRPHMVVFNNAQTHAVISFVASGHVAILDATTRAPVACIDVGLQARVAVPAPDDSYILVANANDKLLQRISADFTTNTFTLDAPATLDLANCTTPGGIPCEDAVLRPDNAPISPVITPSSDLALVTLRGGGMFVVNPRTTPIAIRGEYSKAVVHPVGVGGMAVGDAMFINSGGGTATTPSGFDVYRFSISAFSPTTPNAAETPAPTVLFSNDVSPRDAQGMGLAKGDKYLWVVDRGTHVAEVFNVATGAHTGTIQLWGPESSDLTAQLVDFSPTGNLAFFSLRGPVPLTGGPSAAGQTPGLGVYQVTANGANAIQKAVYRITNPSGGVETADAHALAVRRR